MITFYYTIDADSDYPWLMPPDVRYMLPASSWARQSMRPPRLPDGVEVAADCGGFVATFRWGDYRYTPRQYVEWLNTFRPTWAATMDYCCEDEITAGKPGIVRERQAKTSEMAWALWCGYRDVPWAWVPTVQGWHVDDYRRHARELKPLITEMRRHYGDGAYRVGIGTLCARASVRMVHQVVATVGQELPGTPLHLWGVKLRVLKSPLYLTGVASVDSAAWNGWFIGQSHDQRREQEGLGMTKRQYNYAILLQRYREKVQRALAQPKQMRLL